MSKASVCELYWSRPNAFFTRETTNPVFPSFVDGMPACATFKRFPDEPGHSQVGVQVAPGRPLPAQDLQPALVLPALGLGARRQVAEKRPVSRVVHDHGDASGGTADALGGRQVDPRPVAVFLHHAGTEILAEARSLLASRRNGAEFMLEALRRHYDFLSDVLRSPPVGPIADALSAMGEKRPELKWK